MRIVSPKVYLLAETGILRDIDSPLVDTFETYLEDIGASEWAPDTGSDPEILSEIAGRLCYKSFAVGLNPNVTKIRTGNEQYLGNIIESRHGSVLEHSCVSFLFLNVSRVFTHELVRHRVGVGISQESMRYVRLSDIPFWMPDWAKLDQDLHLRCLEVLKVMEDHQRWMVTHFGLDEPGADFGLKKHKTSFMRRFAPCGVATAIMWTANFRTLRHVLELRTSLAAEEEARLVFDEVGEICKRLYGNIFKDFSRNEDGEWIPRVSKV